MGKLLARAGFPVLFVAGRRLSAARQAARFIGSGRPVRLGARDLAEAPVFLVTVSDAALHDVTLSLAEQVDRWRGKIVLHTCGSVGVEVLEPLRRRGAAVGALHPFQTIPSARVGVRNLRGGFWAVEGDLPARKIAREWVKALEGKSFKVRPSQRTLYHLSAFLVCPTVVTLMDGSRRLLRRSGVPARIVRPMLGQFVGETVRNFVELGGRKALSGPAVRGDWVTIRRHLRALRRAAPELVPAYRALLRIMLQLAGREAPRRAKPRRHAP